MTHQTKVPFPRWSRRLLAANGMLLMEYRQTEQNYAYNTSLLVTCLCLVLISLLILLLLLLEAAPSLSIKERIESSGKLPMKTTTTTTTWVFNIYQLCCHEEFHRLIITFNRNLLLPIYRTVQRVAQSDGWGGKWIWMPWKSSNLLPAFTLFSTFAQQ